MNSLFDIYQTPEYDDAIQKIETRTYYPYVKSFNNNDSIEITINQSDAWLQMYSAAIIIEGTLKKAEQTPPVEGTVKFVNNAGSFLFDSVTYELNGKEVDTVRDPGIVSTIKGYLCYNETNSKHMSIASWSPNDSIEVEQESFIFRIPLHHWFGIFNDYKCIQFGKQTIRLIRARSDQDSVIVSNSGITPELKINNVSLRVNIVHPNDLLKLSLLESIKADKPIVIPFRKWTIHELPQLTTGSNRQIWPIKTSTALECPRYIIVAFQTNLRDDITKDPTKFNNCYVSDIRVLLNGEYYPVERQQNNFLKEQYVEAYYNYSQFYQSFMNDSSLPICPFLDYKNFSNRCLFVIDCSTRNEPFKSSTVDIKLDIETPIKFSASTKAYCIIIHDAIIEHLPLSEVVRYLN